MFLRRGTRPALISPRYAVVWMLALLILTIAVTGCNIEFNPKPIPQPFPGTGPLPTSGFEHAFEPALWNDGGLIQNSTNCYAYMLNRPWGFPAGHKLQPGELHGNPLSSASDVNAFRIIELVRQDAIFEGFIFEDAPPDQACPAGTYKVALVVDPGVDYHWYRQNPDGTWSGKGGHGAATDLDASGNVITDPRTADRNYGFINYYEFGGFFCVDAFAGP